MRKLDPWEAMTGFERKKSEEIDEKK